LSDWGVKYHKLLFGKPDYDVLVCDKAASWDKLGALFDGKPGFEEIVYGPDTETGRRTMKFRK
jgi:hypothetical protein